MDHNSFQFARVFLGIVLMLLALPVRPSPADYLVLNDGRRITGRIVEETDTTIRIETEISGIRTTVNYARSIIDHYVIEEGDEDRPPVDDPPPAERRAPSDAPARQAPAGPLVMVVPLHELLVEYLEEDAELLGRLRRLIDTNTSDGLVEAAERFDAVIEGWMTLLGDCRHAAHALKRISLRPDLPPSDSRRTTTVDHELRMHIRDPHQI